MEMAEVMKKEYEKATELEKLKEVEKVQQSVQYQEMLEKQLEEQVQKLGKVNFNSIIRDCWTTCYKH